MSEEVLDRAHAAGAAHAREQIEGSHFMDWVREQVAEAERLPPGERLPLETKADARAVAKNMLQQLQWDTDRQLGVRDIVSLVGDTGDVRDADVTGAFFEGFRDELRDRAVVDWLAGEVLALHEGAGGEAVREADHRAHIYVWQISLQVTSPERPNLKHELQYRVQAPSNGRDEAVEKAKALAARDGKTVVGVTGAARG